MAPPIEEAQFSQDSEMCCNEDELDWDAKPLPCHMRSFMRPNYTNIAFPSRRARVKLLHKRGHSLQDEPE
jgi:hypothetical protein